MQLRLTNIRLPVDVPEDALPVEVARLWGTSGSDFQRIRILRKSLDARAHANLQFVYTLQVDIDDARLAERLLLSPGAIVDREERFEEPESGNSPLAERPIVVGSGPAGILAAYYLARRGYRPLILERGDPVKTRVSAIRAFDRGGPHDEENNYLFGEGGAGTFSDGKLTCRMSGPDVDWVLRHFVECGGKPSIRYEYRPHLGSNRLPMIVRNFRRRIEAWGGEYRFRCRLEGLSIADGRLRGVLTSSGPIAASLVILAIGHSARDTYDQLHDADVPMEAKAFQLGLRIEQPQQAVNQFKYANAQYLRLLGAADYALTARGERDVFTFCMCAGGYIIPSISEAGMFCTNGMSNSRHDSPFANSGIVVTLDPTEFGASLPGTTRDAARGIHPLAGVRLQQRFESLAYRLGRGSYRSPLQQAVDFVNLRSPPPTRPDANPAPPCSYPRGAFETSLDQILPTAVARAIRAGLPIMDRSWGGAFLRDAILVGPEMRGSSPVRIVRDAISRQTPGIAGLYPVGEGAGYAGGIVSAAVDGLRSAKSIVHQFAPLEPR
ncbi:MAG: FAD-dependent oxidoreductase [Planctomycetes bacterium]|nr:FAD-dependent oxidoreductase [Planctomycetota bacterium]